MKSKTSDQERGELQNHIVSLVKRTMTSLDAEASSADLLAALRELCRVYALFYRTGDLDDSGSALGDYRKRFNTGGGGTRDRSRSGSNGTATDSVAD